MGYGTGTGTFFGYNVFVGRFSVIPDFGFTGISHLPSILAGTNVVEVTGNECTIPAGVAAGKNYIYERILRC